MTTTMDTQQKLFVLSCIFLICKSAVAQDDLFMTYRVSSDRFVQDTSNNFLDYRGGEHKYMKKYMLSPDITCNDGSPAGYYLRQSNHSRIWIVFLEEGWCCYDKVSCDERWSRAEYLMSSKDWPENRHVGGILSNNANENPYWWQANHVFVPYCTSDIWTGRRAEPQHGSRFSFMGSIVIKEVIRQLLPKGLANAHSLILSGSSAGGVGVMMNLDPISKMLRQYSGMSVHGITDSGWFVEQPFNFAVQKKKDSPTSIEAVKMGIPYWHSQIPSKCRNLHIKYPSKCFLGYKIYPTLSVPLFVFQWLYDEFQLKNDISNPITKQQWDYIHKTGGRLRRSLMNVTGLFSPSCVSHTVLTKKDWKNIKIDSVSLPTALHSWQLDTRQEKVSKTKSGRTNRNNGNRSSSKAAKKSAENALKKKRKVRRNGQKPRVDDEHERTHEKRRRHQKPHGNHQKHHGGHQKHHGDHRQEPHGPHHQEPIGDLDEPETEYLEPLEDFQAIKLGEHQHIGNCTWPQCNNSCPRLQNPITGEAVDFIELLQSFGVNIPNLSSELGIDMESLIHMDRGELLRMLTQQSN